MLPDDAPVLAEIFRASIDELTGDDYSPSQREAWSAQADDEEAFAERFSSRLTLVALLDGSPAGFVALEDNRILDMLYVHPAAVGQGAAALLCDAVERLAAARGSAEITVEASDTARDFFDKRGYGAEQRTTISLGDEWLANTTMKKKLAGTEGQ